MRSHQDLEKTLKRIDGKGYKAYKDIVGTYAFRDFELMIDHVQGDPFAAPSSVRVRFRHDYPAESYSNRSREVALRDFITRRFADAIKRVSKGGRGSGKSGRIEIDRPGQEVLERTSVFISDKVEVRFTVGLPAFGRTVAGRHAYEIFFDEIPRLVNALQYGQQDTDALWQHVKTVEDADALRDNIRQEGFIGFVNDGALLPRASGVDQRPLSTAVPFASPESMRVTFELPNRTVQGMGIARGINLIVGGGYHGKSTLLQALERGIYNHVPGDGRDFVVSDPLATKVRAEDGRSISSVNISPFIPELPFGKATERFSTENASGSTSQAANIVEVIEAGATALLIDEDTSATNFMIRDERMQELVPKRHEPITPYIDKAQQLYQDEGISTILVIGGSGEYFDIADRVICMIEYQPYDMTGEAKGIAEQHAKRRAGEGGDHFGAVSRRIPEPNSVSAEKGNKQKLGAMGVNALQFGTETIDLSAVEQLVDGSQVRAIGKALLYAKRYMDRPLSEMLDAVMSDMQQSLDVLGRSHDYAWVRRIELACALNRLRTLRIRQ